MVVFVNNAVFGMTGGQMAPTTMPDQETTTSPFGRDTDLTGYPIKMAELLSGLQATSFVARAAVDSPKNLLKAKKYLRQAFEVQLNHNGFSFVEFLSACPTNWKLSPQEANKRIGERMIPYYPLGVYKEAV